MNENQQLQRIEPPQAMALDAVGRKAAIDDLLNKVALVQEVMTKVMHDGEHFGKIPGCGDKPALLKAGAEKLGMTFRLQPRFDVSERDLGNSHREYSVTCTLSDGTQGVGSCNTMESKYRYRTAERRCPKCGKAAIIQGKSEFGGGWLCWAKKQGCGAKFAADDFSITSQNAGKVEHDNPADYFNTCLKMGKKRAHVDAIITATACSDIFTQDVEEMVQNAEAGKPDISELTVQPKPAPGPTPAPTAVPSAPQPTTAYRDRLCAILQPQIPIALEYFQKVSAILPNEGLDDIPLDFIPATKEEMSALMRAIGEFASGDEAKLPYPRHAVHASTAAKANPMPMPAPVSTQPNEQTDAAAEPWYDVIITIPHKGQKRDEYLKNPDTIGSLYEARHGSDEESQAARQRLWGFVSNFEPKPWTGRDGLERPASAADVKLREALDLFADWFSKTHPDEKL